MRINIENDFRYHARAKNSDWVIQSKLIQYGRKPTSKKSTNHRLEGRQKI